MLTACSQINTAVMTFAQDHVALDPRKIGLRQPSITSSLVRINISKASTMILGAQRAGFRVPVLQEGEAAQRLSGRGTSLGGQSLGGGWEQACRAVAQP